MDDEYESNLDSLLDLNGSRFFVDDAGKRNKRHDHRHRMKTVKPYDYQDAEKLLADFWKEVDRLLKERGVIS
jgi:hypothetical protein